MEINSLLKRVKVVLGLDEETPVEVPVELAEAMLIDGETMVKAEKFEVGYTLYFYTNEDLIPALPGEYTLSDGTKLVVDEVGVIQEVIVKEEEEVVEEMNDEPSDKISREEFNTLLDKISKIEEAMLLSVETFEKQSEEFKNKIQKLSEAPAAEPIRPRLTVPQEENALVGLLKKKK
jgi:hypothetical protein